MAKDEKSICSEVQGVPIELASNPGLSVRVLAVDDEHSARKLLSVILGQSGFVARPSMEAKKPGVFAERAIRCGDFRSADAGHERHGLAYTSSP